MYNITHTGLEVYGDAFKMLQGQAHTGHRDQRAPADGYDGGAGVSAREVVLSGVLQYAIPVAFT